MYLENYCKKIYVSSTSLMENNCDAVSCKCKTFDDVVKISLNDRDHKSFIILDGGDTERSIYTVKSHNIALNKSILIKGDPNSKFYPVIKSLGRVNQGNYLFIVNKDNINIIFSQCRWIM